jgi:hypothetical protein
MLKIARRPPVRSTRNASRTIPALSRKWWSAYWQLAKSNVPEANGNAEAGIQPDSCFQCAR